MKALYYGFRAGASRTDRHADKKGQVVVGGTHRHSAFFKKIADFLLSARRRAQHVQRKLGSARNDACCDCGFYTLQSPRIGYCDASRIFDYVAAKLRLAYLRLAAKRLFGGSGGVGNGDRLGAARRGHKLFFENSVENFFFAGCQTHKQYLFPKRNGFSKKLYHNRAEIQ